MEEGAASESASADSSSSSARTASATAAAVPLPAAGAEVGRSLIVDESFFEEQFLRCQVCHERFDLHERSPKSLPCNHTFCFPCLTQIFDHAQPPARRTLVWADETLDGTLKCPTCRVEIFVSRNKIKELPNDHRVVQMMDFLSQAVAKSQNVCSKHDRQPLNFFCQKCLVPVCRDCTVLDHKESDGHAIIDVSKALSENSTQFNDIEKKSRETLEKMKARSDSLANGSKRLDILERHLKNEIKETFIEYRLLLEKRQEALTSIAQDIIKEQKALINARFVNVCEHGTQLQKLYDDFKAARKSNDIRKLFTVQNQMTEHDNEFTEVAAHDDIELYKSCEFETQNEGAFLSDMMGLGEVHSKLDPQLKEPISAHQLVVLDMEKKREEQQYSRYSQYAGYEEDEVLAASVPLDDEFDNLDLHADDPSSDDVTELADDLPSRLISRYIRQIQTPGDHQGSAESMRRSSSRANHRRGRRSRDTNSSQVTSSLSMDHSLSQASDLNSLRRALAAVGSGDMMSSRYPRTSSSRSNHHFRVVRHEQDDDSN